MQFTTKNKFLNKRNIEHDNKMILQNKFCKILGYNNRHYTFLEKHIDTITPKLNKTCYIIRSSKLYLSNDALKMVYYEFFTL